MLEILKYIGLGIVQGFTEFLPVSSSGHIAVFQRIFGMGEDTFTSIMLHFGTLIAVVLFYFKDLIALFKRENHKTIWHLVIATVPAVVVMAVLKFGFKMDDLPSKYVCFGFLATAIVLLVTEFVGKKVTDPKPVKGSTALIMGVAQAIAVVPGLSRSGSTIAAGVLSGAERDKAAKFSFFMSIPIILGTVAVELITLGTSHAGFEGINILGVVLGTAASAACGYIAIKFMIRLIGKCNFKWFSLYLFALSITTFITIFLA